LASPAEARALRQRWSKPVAARQRRPAQALRETRRQAPEPPWAVARLAPVPRRVPAQQQAAERRQAMSRPAYRSVAARQRQM
jgi:hypothetical protein